MLKTCTKCKEAQALSEFYRHKGYADGYNSYCKNCFKQYQVEYKSKNRIKIRERKKEWSRNNKNKVRSYDKRYYDNNKDKVHAYNAKRRANRLQAIPRGLIERDHINIIRLYKDIKECQWLSESKLEVDHIIPLKHKNVCGLHVIWNLQVLTKKENNIKKNKFDGTYENNSWKARIK